MLLSAPCPASSVEISHGPTRFQIHCVFIYMANINDELAQMTVSRRTHAEAPGAGATERNAQRSRSPARGWATTGWQRTVSGCCPPQLLPATRRTRMQGGCCDRLEDATGYESWRIIKSATIPGATYQSRYAAIEEEVVVLNLVPEALDTVVSGVKRSDLSES